MSDAREFRRHPLTRSLAAVVALVVVLGLAQLTLTVQAGTGAPQTGRAPVMRTTIVCPHPSGRVAVASSPAESPAEEATGRAVVHELGADGGRSRLDPIRRRGVVRTAEPGERAPATVVRARGSMAAGLEVEQTAADGAGAGQGLSAARCARPGESFWFVGGGVELGRTTTLYLVNPGGTQVSVNAAVYGPEGPVSATDAGGAITVQPRSRKSIRLGALAPRARVAAVHVRSSGGPVVAALHTSTSSGGADWVPRATSPRTELVVPGLPGGGGSRRLLLAAPGDRAATVRLQLVTSEGTYPPRGKRSVRVQPGSVASVDLTDSLSRRPAAVRLTSDAPVTAGAVVSSGTDGGNGGGTAYLSAVPALSGGSVVATNAQGSGMESRLLLSAPADTGEVRVTVFGSEGPVGASGVARIPAGGTVSARLSPPQSIEGNFAVVVTPTEDSGRVYGARMLRGKGEDPSVTILPLRTSQRWVRVPNAEQSLGVVIPSP